MEYQICPLVNKKNNNLCENIEDDYTTFNNHDRNFNLIINYENGKKEKVILNRNDVGEDYNSNLLNNGKYFMPINDTYYCIDKNIMTNIMFNDYVEIFAKLSNNYTHYLCDFINVKPAYNNISIYFNKINTIHPDGVTPPLNVDNMIFRQIINIFEEHHIDFNMFYKIIIDSRPAFARYSCINFPAVKFISMRDLHNILLYIVSYINTIHNGLFYVFIVGNYKTIKEQNVIAKAKINITDGSKIYNSATNSFNIDLLSTSEIKINIYKNMLKYFNFRPITSIHFTYDNTPPIPREPFINIDEFEIEKLVYYNNLRNKNIGIFSNIDSILENDPLNLPNLAFLASVIRQQYTTGDQDLLNRFIHYSMYKIFTKNTSLIIDFINNLIYDGGRLITDNVFLNALKNILNRKKLAEIYRATTTQPSFSDLHNFSDPAIVLSGGSLNPERTKFASRNNRKNIIKGRAINKSIAIAKTKEILRERERERTFNFQLNFNGGNPIYYSDDEELEYYLF